MRSSGAGKCERLRFFICAARSGRRHRVVFLRDRGVRTVDISGNYGVGGVVELDSSKLHDPDQPMYPDYQLTEGVLRFRV